MADLAGEEIFADVFHDHSTLGGKSNKSMGKRVEEFLARRSG